MMCEGVYQSVICCEVSALITSPTQRRTTPQVQMSGWPTQASRLACTAMAKAISSSGRLSACMKASIRVASELRDEVDTTPDQG